jgi:7,8-dihydropterin-6-yl-methyl-4-(beta-D-ribofuranosyl)aminobenzene 5'-phosphate synthase
MSEMTLSSLPLDELLLTVIVDNETDTLSSVDAGVAQLPEILGHVVRTPPTRTHQGQPCVEAFQHLCVACHGLSILVQARSGDRSTTVLFDVGPYAQVWLANAERLHVDLASIETLFLSHWHWDHSGGIPEVVTAISAARRQAGRPELVVDVHPDRPDQRGVLAPGGPMVLLPPEPTLDEIASAGGVIVEHSEAHGVGAGGAGDALLLGSGAITRTTGYETGLEGHHSLRGGDFVPDPLIMDERFLAGHVTGRGYTVLSACSHAGIVNACLAARAHYPGLPADLVLGGYHLGGAAMEPRITATIDDLDSLIQPRIVAPGHCTGWRAKAALAARFAPGRYGPSVVGTSYVLTAA